MPLPLFQRVIVSAANDPCVVQISDTALEALRPGKHPSLLLLINFVNVYLLVASFMPHDEDEDYLDKLSR